MSVVPNVRTLTPRQARAEDKFFLSPGFFPMVPSVLSVTSVV